MPMRMGASFIYAMIPLPPFLVNGIYKLRANAHSRGGSMGAYGTSQGGGPGVAQPPQPRGGLGVPPTR